MPWFISRRRVRNRSSPAPTRPSVSDDHAADRHLVDHLGRVRGPGAARRHSRSAARAARPSARPGADGHADGGPRHGPARRSCGLIQRYICSSSSRQGWPETWTKWSPSVIDLDALAHQLVVQIVERALVAGDDLGAEDHGVAGLEPDPRVLADGDPRPARCAPRPGCRCRGRARGCAAAARPRARRGSAARSAGSHLARRIDHPAHRAADHEQLAAGGLRRQHGGLHAARRWRRSWSGRPGWAGRRSARSGCRAPRPRSPRCRATARWCCRTGWRARPPCPAPPVRRRRCGSPTSGAGSSFQSPVCSTRPNGVSSTSALASGIEWVTWTKRQAKPADLELLARLDDAGSAPRGRSRSRASLRAQHGGGERRAPDRAAQPRPQIGHGAQMVLVGVGEDQARPA